MKTIKILILRNFTIEPLLEDINEKLKQKNLKAKFLLSGYEDSLNNLINIKSKFYKFKPDIIIFFFSIDTFFKNIKIKSKNKKFILDRIYNDVKMILSEIKKNFDTNIGICNFYNESNYKNFKISNLVNQRLDSYCKSNLNFNLINVSQLLKNFKLNKNTKKYWKQSMYPFDLKSGNKISNLLYKFISIKNGKSHKIIILDADNTLWPGIIGEDDQRKIFFKSKKTAYSFYDFQKDLKKLKNKGILLALCSKNNSSDLKKFFKLKSNKMPIKWNDFCYIQANWSPKSQNIVKILKQINISPENALFIDDSKFEIGEVKNQISKIDTLLMPKEISLLKEIFYQKGNFDIYNITDEDRKRDKLYSDENKRKKNISKFKSNDEYIKSLKIKLDIKLNSKKNLKRLAQMTQKTNQFNSTTIRLNEKKLIKLFLNKNYQIYQCKAKDSFGEYGIVGLAIIRIITKSYLAKIENTLFSCRVLGRKIEEYFYQKIFDRLKQKNIRNVQFDYVKTDKNKPVYQFFKKYNFLEKNEKNGKIKFSKNLYKTNLINKGNLIKYL